MEGRKAIAPRIVRTAVTVPDHSLILKGIEEMTFDGRVVETTYLPHERKTIVIVEKRVE